MDTGWKYFKNKSSHSSKQDRQWQTVHAQIQFTLKYIIVSRKENLLYIRKIKCVKMMTAFIISSNLHKLAKFLHFRNHLVTIVGIPKLLHYEIPYNKSSWQLNIFHSYIHNRHQFNPTPWYRPSTLRWRRQQRKAHLHIRDWKRRII